MMLPRIADLAHADEHDVGVGLAHRHRAHRGAGDLPVGDRRPGLAAVGGLPQAAAGGAEVGLAGAARSRRWRRSSGRRGRGRCCASDSSPAARNQAPWPRPARQGPCPQPAGGGHRPPARARPRGTAGRVGAAAWQAGRKSGSRTGRTGRDKSAREGYVSPPLTAAATGSGTTSGPWRPRDHDRTSAPSRRLFRCPSICAICLIELYLGVVQQRAPGLCETGITRCPARCVAVKSRRPARARGVTAASSRALRPSPPTPHGDATAT